MGKREKEVCVSGDSKKSENQLRKQGWQTQSRKVVKVDTVGKEGEVKLLERREAGKQKKRSCLTKRTVDREGEKKTVRRRRRQTSQRDVGAASPYMKLSSGDSISPFLSLPEYGTRYKVCSIGATVEPPGVEREGRA